MFAGRVKILSHLSCMTRAILKYFCPLSGKQRFKNGTRYMVVMKCIELFPLESDWFVSCLLEKLTVAGKMKQVLESDKSIKSTWLLR